ncbi:MAG: hypothetical protein KAS29_18650 [Bacteroidales bacterium]|nr:hypothetical protein [Bacteroidales bacterium]
MKKQNFLVLMVLLAMMSVQVIAQQKGKFVLNTEEVPEVTHVHLDDFPKGEVLPMIDGWGGMAVDINRAPAGADFSPLLEGLKNDKCQVPHWGYVVEGAIRIIYENGEEDVFSEGEAFFMKSGHTAIVEKDVLLVSFSPEHEMHELADHLNKKVAEMQEHQ